MDGPWKLSVWGARGSLPTPGAEFQCFGGNTSCFCLDWGGTPLILDGGSGLAGLGRALTEQGRRRADILLGHLHLDHVLGLFAFPLFFDPEAEVNLYGAPGLEEDLARLMSPPWWPVGPADFRAKVRFFPTGAVFRPGGDEGLRVTALEGRHPGGCLYYRVEGSGRSLVYALDCEPDEAFLPRLAEFARGTDLLVWDAGFFPGEKKPGWGHSTWAEGLELGRRAGAKRVLMTHYGTDHTDELLLAQQALAREADGRCIFSREGMVIEL